MLIFIILSSNDLKTIKKKNRKKRVDAIVKQRLKIETNEYFFNFIFKFLTLRYTLSMNPSFFSILSKVRRNRLKKKVILIERVPEEKKTIKVPRLTL